MSEVDSKYAVSREEYGTVFAELSNAAYISSTEMTDIIAKQKFTELQKIYLALNIGKIFGNDYELVADIADMSLSDMSDAK